MLRVRSGQESAKGCVLSESPKLAGLPEGVRAELAQICHPVQFLPGNEVVRAGEKPDFIACMRRGILRMQKILPDGEEHIVGLLVEGDVFGRVFDGETQFSVEAATEAEIYAFRRAPFEALLSRTPELERLMLLSVQDELDRARDWLMVLSNRRIEGRLAGFLLVLCKRYVDVDHILNRAGGRLEVHVPISRADMAHLLGTRVETISRAVHALAGRGLLRIKDPSRFEILDLEGLAALTGEDSPGALGFPAPPTGAGHAG